MQLTDNKIRCQWCNKSQLYQDYHDNEWGTPNYDDNYLFQTLILETMQAGLSWYTVLQKRENYRKHIFSYSIKQISNFDNDKKAELLQNEGLIRHKLKIESIINNAQAFLEIQKNYGSFSNYIWSFTDKKIIKNELNTIKEIANKTELSDQISKDLKKKGFKFVGSVTIYAYLQAIGIVNDHIKSCWKY
ncbi:DNA-3-methyladenine glycosylase I [Pseudofrancisella aestuarii]|uniref:DNA-3-methyladenine glycosylase I n=1 Tax=Pseudofrancisella aestuarii TaxID=2670347 RepID=A0ABV9TBG4_9GAMM|nr:DNA-3-methyladenine glycosylase I [Pseudofrancisella aestuarii]